MRLPNSAHTSQPWRVHEIAEDFELEDVWDPGVEGGRDDLAQVVQLAVSLSAGYEYPLIFRALFALRWRLGAVFGWDEEGSGIGSRVPSLLERIPGDLRSGPRGPDLHAVPGRHAADADPIFVSLYQTRDEWLTEYASETVHSLMHIGWVSGGPGKPHRARMTVLVKPNGWRGRAYMAAIKPFRYILYPLQLRAFARHWTARARPRRVGVSEPVATTAGYDHAAAFELHLDAPSDRSPEEWLGAGFEADRRAGRPGCAQIVESDSSVAVLKGSGPLSDFVVIGRNLEGDRRRLTTLMRLRRRRFARPVTAMVASAHLRDARRSLSRAHRQGAASRGPRHRVGGTY